MGPFTPAHQVLMLVGAGVAALVASGFLVRAFTPRWRRTEFRLAPVGVAVLLLVVAVGLILVACATPFMVRHPLWLPMGAVLGLTISFLAHQYDEGRDRAAQARTAPSKELRKIARTFIEAQKGNYLLWAVVFVGALLLMIELREIYFSMAIGVGFFLLFVVPPKDRSTVAKLFGLLALWGVPTLWSGIKVSQFLILSVLYGVEPVWSNTIRVTRAKPFIQLSNGDEFHGFHHLLWSLVTFIVIVIIAASWLALLVWLAKRLYPPFYETWREFRKPRNHAA